MFVAEHPAYIKRHTDHQPHARCVQQTVGNKTNGYGPQRQSTRRADRPRHFTQIDGPRWPVI